MFAIGPKSPLYGVLDDVLSGKSNGNIATLKWALGQLAYPEAVLEKLVESLKEIRMIHCLHNGPLSKVYHVEFPYVCEGPSVLKLYGWPPNVASIRYKYGQDRLDGELLGLSLKQCPYLLESLQVIVLNEKNDIEFIRDPKEMQESSGIVLGVFSAFISGAKDLLGMLEENPILIKKNRCRLARSIGFAVYSLHKEYGMAHRDIKPENILIDGKLNPRLFDYGFLVEGKQGNRTSVLGTQEYMDPQILSVRAKISHDYDPFLSDAYSLAVLLYVLRFGLFPQSYSDDERAASGSLKEMDFLLVNGKEFSNIKERFPEGVFPKDEDDAALFEVIKLLGYRAPQQRTSVIDVVEQHPFFKKKDTLSLSLAHLYV